MSISIIFLKYFLFLIFRFVFNTCQSLLYLLDGTYARIQKMRGNFATSGLVLDIKARHTFDPLQGPLGLINFITSFHEMVHPKYILQDTVSLYSISPNELIFVEVPPSVEVYNSDCATFLAQAQYENAERVIVLPMASAVQLAGELDEMRERLIFLCNTGRCGSTLTTQILEKTECCVAFSEPKIMRLIADMSRLMKEEEVAKRLQVAVRLLCKPVKNRNIDAFVVKLDSPSLPFVSNIYKVFPSATYLFMYREGLPTAKSYIKLYTQLPLYRIAMFLKRFSASLAGLVVSESGHVAEVQTTTMLSYCLFCWAKRCKMYCDMRKEGVNINAVKYEGILQNMEESIIAILTYCGLEKHSKKVVDGSFKDSQRNSSLSRSNLAQIQVEDLSASGRVEADVICGIMSLPPISQPCELEGTINITPRDH